MAERIGARNGTGGAVLREIMRLDTHFWARRVWVDFRKVSCFEPEALFPFLNRFEVRRAGSVAGDEADGGLRAPEAAPSRPLAQMRGPLSREAGPSRPAGSKADRFISPRIS